MSDPNSDPKTQLFAAAVRVFAEKGYRGATVRDICAEAGAANASAVNYHFGGKDALYRDVLEALYAALGRAMDQSAEEDRDQDPPGRLRTFLRAYCRLLYQGGPRTEGFLRIHAMEMANPSRHLPEMVDRHLAPQTRRQLALVADLIGRPAPEAALADCLAGIIGQAAYYAFTRPLYDRAFPDLTLTPARVEALADHVWRFSLAGIEEMRRQLEENAYAR